MADIRKFLDQSGVSILWTRIAEELKAEQTRAEAAEAANAAAAKAAQDDVDALELRVDGIVGEDAGKTIRAIAEEEAAKKDEAILAAQNAANKAQEEVDAVEVDLGDVDGLSTTNKTVVGAINEVLAAVGTGGTAAVVTITSDTTTEGALKSYTVKQGTTTVGVIDIPKDMVVESGSVVTNPEGQPEGTYIKLVLANVTEPLYINVGHLVDIYKAKSEATQVQLAIDPATREISATIVAGSITSTELADNAVVTSKIADANVTKAKLSTAVQASLDKADAAATKAEFDEEVARAKAAEAQALTDAKAYTDEKVGAEKERAEGIEAGLESRLQAVEGKLGTGEGNVASLIATAKQEAIDAAAADATSKANTAEANAKSYTDTEIAKIQALTEEEIDAAIANATTGA